MTNSSSQSSVDGHIQGLDTVRFFCALWVFFSHGGAPPNFPKDGSTWNLIVRGLYGNLWAGVAAVIVFFVISGFCIHYPYARSGTSPNLAVFYTRRFIRLLLPVAAIIPISAMAGLPVESLHTSILWSLLAETIYYLIYPTLRIAQQWLGSWARLIGLSAVFAVAVAASDLSIGDYHGHGPFLTWMLGLPCWLLGCLLAERIGAKSVELPQVTSGIWRWRFAVIAAAWICSALRFHSPLKYSWTLDVFAVLAAAWLYREIIFRKHAKAPRVFEWAGTWSFSLYLVHEPAKAVFKDLYPDISLGILSWVFLVSFVFCCSYAFHLVVEKPSHLLARKLGRMFSNSFANSTQVSLARIPSAAGEIEPRS